MNTFGANSKLLKTYNNILPHFRGRITFYFLKIDDWIANNLIFKCDDQIFTASTLSNPQEIKLCGDPEIFESLRRIDITFPHSKTNMNIEISTD